MEAAFLFPRTAIFVCMKQVKCPSCSSWYMVTIQSDAYGHICSHCNAPYAVKTEEQKAHEEGMKAPVSKPPLAWKRFGEMHWTLVILNNVGFVIQTILFMIGTIIGILVAPL